MERMRRALAPTLRHLDRCRTTVWTRLKQAALWVYGACIRVRVIGRVSVPLRRGFIVAANHMNGADSLVLQAALHTRLFFAASADWFKGRISRFIMWHICDAIPVKTGDPYASTGGLRHCLKALQSGGSIGIYPEGTFHTSGRFGDIKAGAAWLAVRSGAPILPVYIRNLKYENQVDSSTRRRECWTGFLTVAGNLFNTDLELLVGDPIVPLAARATGPDQLQLEVERVNELLTEELDQLSAASA
jgi:1-acyl-sn-glycerol-3-phosphate acyltransferase